MHSQHSCFKHLNHRETNKQTGHVWNDVSGAVCVCVFCIVLYAVGCVAHVRVCFV